MISAIGSANLSTPQDPAAPESTPASGTPSAATSHVPPEAGSALQTDRFTPSSKAAQTDEPSMDTVSLTPGAARAEKVEALRAQISAGTYEIDPSRVAEAMLRKGLFNPNVQ